MTKQLPQDYETEMLILGCCMKDPEGLETVVQYIKSNDFFTSKHIDIYNIILDIHRESKPVDLTTVSHELRSSGFKMKNYSTHLVECLGLVLTTTNAKHYCDIISKYADLRTVIKTFESGAEKGYAGKDEPEKIIDEAETTIMSLNSNRGGNSFDSINNASKLVIEDVESTLRGEKFFITSGIDELDNMLHGFVNTDLYIIAGRPGMGKTSLAMNIAENASRSVPVGVCSLEMSKQQLAERMIFANAGIDVERSKPTFKDNKIIPPALTDEENDRIKISREKVGKLNIEIDDTPALDIQTLKSKAKQLKSKCGIKLLIVDYIQLMDGAGLNRTEEISKISRGLKLIAKELNIPVIALSQLSRALESRSNKRPMLSDLRDSGAIEADADVVIFTYREIEYLQHLDPQDPKRKDKEGVAELIIGKNRHGRTGIIDLAFIKERTKFCNLTFRPEDYR